MEQVIQAVQDLAEKLENRLIREQKPKEKPSRFVIAAIVILVVVVGLGIGGLVYSANLYKDRVLPSLQIGAIPLGGMKRDEVRALLSDVSAKLIKEGFSFTYEVDGEVKKFTVYPSAVREEDGTELVKFNIEAETDAIMSYGKKKSVLARGWETIYSRLVDLNIQLEQVVLDKDRLLAEVKQVVGQHESLSRNASVNVTAVDPLVYSITSAVSGVVFNYDAIASQAVQRLSILSPVDIRISSQVEEPQIREVEVQAITGQLPILFARAPVTISYLDSHTKKTYTWKITSTQVGTWIKPEKKTGELRFVLDYGEVKAWFEEKILPQVNVEAQNAKFVLNESKTKVIEFEGSRSGITADVQKTYDAIDVVLHESDRTKSTVVDLVIAKVEPQIKTENTNDLGIKEILGIGYSNFSGSPKNRVLNIKNAVKNKLHGTLVAPGGEFSLVQTLRPFTIEAGYLPELVIKGNRITPEVAGGLCQIGTTMFRAAMNAGLPITARTNHGLVVSYYNDPRNGNPGTDATIYDGWPDFRFLNDTGKYLLIITEMNSATGDLSFIIWGTSDGRKGSYTAPKVLQWIPAGPYQEVQTTSLPSGKKECQTVHNGAVATFTYIRELPNGEKIEREFKSVYRAVPAMCFIGVDKEKLLPECVLAPDGSVTCPDKKPGDQVPLAG